MMEPQVVTVLLERNYFIELEGYVIFGKMRYIKMLNQLQ